MLKLNELHVHGKMTVKFSSLKKKWGGGGGMSEGCDWSLPSSPVLLVLQV